MASPIWNSARLRCGTSWIPGTAAVPRHQERPIPAGLAAIRAWYPPASSFQRPETSNRILRRGAPVTLRCDTRHDRPGAVPIPAPYACCPLMRRTSPARRTRVSWPARRSAAPRRGRTLHSCKYPQSTRRAAPRGSQLERHATARSGCQLWPWVSEARFFFIFYGRTRSAAVDCRRRSTPAVRRSLAIERLTPQRSRVEKNSDTARHPDAKRDRQRQDERAG